MSLFMVTYDHLIATKQLYLVLYLSIFYFKEWPLEKLQRTEENITVNSGESNDTDEQRSDSEDFGAVSDEANASNENDKEIHSSDEEQSLSPKISQSNDNKSANKTKALPNSSIDILLKIFPNHKTKVLSNSLKECGGDVLQTIEQLVNSSNHSNGKRKISNEGIAENKLKSETLNNNNNNNNNNIDNPQLALVGYKHNQNSVSAKDHSPKSNNKCLPQFNAHSANMSLHPHQQPFLSMLTNISNNSVGIPPPLVSSMTTNASAQSSRSTMGSSRTSTTTMGSQYSHSNVNLTSSLPRGLFGSVASPYAGLFPVFPTSATNLNFSLFAGSGNTAHNNCSSTAPFTMPNDSMASLDHLHVPLKRNSNSIITENDWFTDAKRISSSTISVAHDKKSNPEFVGD